MERSNGRTPTPSLSSLGKFVRVWPRSAWETLFLVAVGLAAGLGFALSPPVRNWILQSLGWGWVPASFWLGAALITYRYDRRLLARNWRWWVIGAAAASIAIGALSLFHTGEGVLAEASLGGRWGGVLAGTPVAVAVAKLIAIVVLVPLTLFPRRVGTAYRRGLRYAGLGLRQGAGYLYHSGCVLARNISALLNKRHRRRLAYWVRCTFLRNPVARAKAGPSAPVLSELPESPSLWADTEIGTVPGWPSLDALPPEEFEERLRELELTVPGQESLDGLPPEETDWEAKKGVPDFRWRLPTLDLLAPPDSHHALQGPLERMARHVESALAEHGVTVEVKDIKAGPRIVRFGLVPGWIAKRGEGIRENPVSGKAERSRVKVQSILTREKDLALALKTPFLRIEAPVPGEALVGLEVPSPSPSKVHLKEVMETQAFKRVVAKGGLPIALGQDTGGSPVVMDLTETPHFLIAGATGSGKSVCINSIVASLLFTRPPSQLRLLMVDPKRVELTPFNGIPHLIAPVIVDIDGVNVALRALTQEMMRRYKQMEEAGARNIDGYNAKAKERFPYLVLVVDELADLMMAGGFKVEQNLVRLAQLGRATGIHLVLATQRPSVNVVTGLLKANIPTRVAFAVASQVDSRVILDTVGAEKLLGKGDMLLLHHESPKPRRVQGTLVYDAEIDKLVKFWTNQKGPPLLAIPMADSGDEAESGEEVDERLVDEARDMAIRNPRLSSSFLERRLRIGGRRASQIIEQLEDEGLVTPR